MPLAAGDTTSRTIPIHLLDSGDLSLCLGLKAGARQSPLRLSHLYRFCCQQSPRWSESAARISQTWLSRSASIRIASVASSDFLPAKLS
jgi:hypothetical protein